MPDRPPLAHEITFEMTSSDETSLGRRFRQLTLGLKSPGGFSSICRFVLVERMGRRPIRDWARLKPNFVKKTGVEVGGPSAVFSGPGAVPIYPIAASIDFVDYAEQTIWSAQGSDDRRISVPSGIGQRRWILGTSDLHALPQGRYDFLLASHVLEHIANPIKALHEWIRLLRAGGFVVVVVPNKDWTLFTCAP